MLEAIELGLLEDEKWRIEDVLNTCTWFHKRNGGKNDSFRLDLISYDEEKKTLELHILVLSKSKAFKEEWMKMIEKIIQMLPNDMNIIITKSTPESVAWKSSTNFSYMWVPILLFNLCLYLLTLNYLPKGETVSILFLVFSLPFGYILSSTHHWGAGAPFAGFEQMIKAIRWKYACLNFCFSLIALTVISLVL